MSENKSDVIFDGRPQILSVCVSFLDIARRTVKQVSEEIRDDVDDGLIQREGEGRQFVFDQLPCTCVRTQVQLEPMKAYSDLLYRSRRITNHSAFIQPSRCAVW